MYIPKQYASKIFGYFLTKFIKGDPEDCWEWFGGVNKSNGYPRFMVNYFEYSAHIVSYAYFNNILETNLHVLHECDNKICVNPNHLFLGTHLDNMRDKMKKGRSRTIGEINTQSKLTEQEVIEIREKYKTGNYTYKSLSREYGVDQTTIGHIVTNVQWKYLLNNKQKEYEEYILRIAGY